MVQEAGIDGSEARRVRPVDPTRDKLYDSVKAKLGMRAMTPHMPYLRDLAEQCDVAVEIGTRGGSSTVSLSYAAELHSFDIQSRRQDEWVWGRLARFGNWAFHIGTPAPELDIPECDILLLDDLHEYGHVLAELEKYAPSVRRWIVLHDTESCGEHGQAEYGEGEAIPKPNESLRGINDAIDEFLAEHPEWEKVRHVEYGNGLTTLERVR